MENGLEMGSQKKPNDLLSCRKEGTTFQNEDEKKNNYVLNYATNFFQHSLTKKRLLSAQAYFCKSWAMEILTFYISVLI